MMSNTFIQEVRDRYISVREKIDLAAHSVGRKPSDVGLVVVSKMHSIESISLAIQAGINLFGENYAEEAINKIRTLKQHQIEWHMIGHVQSRKANLVAGNYSLVHSLDSFKLAQRLNRFSEEAQKQQAVLLEVNVSGEGSKFGYAATSDAEVSALYLEVEQILQLSGLRLCGLMTMPPYFEQSEQSRPYFKRLRVLREQLREKFPSVSWNELSMGTSVDYVVAVQEGATLVRVGTAIMGSRPVRGEPA